MRWPESGGIRARADLLRKTRTAGDDPSIRTGRLIRVLHFAHAEGEHDVPDATDEGDRRHPRNEEDRAAPVVSGGPEAERELDDAADQLEPPDLDLAPNGDGNDDVERPREHEKEAEHGRQRDERIARMD